MNSLVIIDGEGWDSGLIVLNGERVRELPDHGRVEVGDCIRVARYGGDVGTARVVRVSSERVELELFDVRPSLPLRPIDLIVGLSRPQTIKKVVQAAVMSGVRSLHLVHCDSGQRSYLDSHLLGDQALSFEIRKALEQIWQGRYPEIAVHRSFSYLAKNRMRQLVQSAGAVAVVAQPGGALLNQVCTERSPTSLVIGVGSEGGWSDRELSHFDELGFARVGLGQRVVRVELAVLYLLGQSLQVFD